MILHLFWSTTDVVDLLEVGDVVAWPVAFLCQELPSKETNIKQWSQMTTPKYSNSGLPGSYLQHGRGLEVAPGCRGSPWSSWRWPCPAWTSCSRPRSTGCCTFRNWTWRRCGPTASLSWPACWPLWLGSPPKLSRWAGRISRGQRWNCRWLSQWLSDHWKRKQDVTFNFVVLSSSKISFYIIFHSFTLDVSDWSHLLSRWCLGIRWRRWSFPEPWPVLRLSPLRHGPRSGSWDRTASASGSSSGRCSMSREKLASPCYL